MSATEDRAARLAIAEALRLEMRCITQRIDVVINHMLSDADALKLEAADEASRGDVPKTKVIVYEPKVDVVVEDVSKTIGLTPTGRIDTTKPNLTTPSGRKRRTCSHCGEPGHWATSCPDKEAEALAERRERMKKARGR